MMKRENAGNYQRMCGNRRRVQDQPGTGGESNGN